MTRLKRFAIAAGATLALSAGLLVAPSVDLNPLDHSHDGSDGPVASAQAHDLKLGCHHSSSKSPSLSVWEEGYSRATTLRIVGGSTYHNHIYKHYNLIAPWQNHEYTKLCGKYTSSGTLIHY
jgi:hypothetical protein